MVINQMETCSKFLFLIFEPEFLFFFQIPMLFFLTLKMALHPLAQGVVTHCPKFSARWLTTPVFPFYTTLHAHSPFYKKGVRELTRLFFRAQKHSKMTKLRLWGDFDLHTESNSTNFAIFKRNIFRKFFSNDFCNEILDTIYKNETIFLKFNWSTGIFSMTFSWGCVGI